MLTSLGSEDIFGMRLALLGILHLAFSSSLTFAFPAKFGLSPDNSLELLVSTIRSARSSLLVNVYELESLFVAKAIADRVKAGVRVEIMVEGKPAISRKLTEEAKKALDLVQREMKKHPKHGHRIFVKSATSRFVYNHAKYVVVDGRRVLVSTDNFKNSGHPEHGRVGNRGWEVVVSDAKLARELTDIFKRDSDRSHGDIEEPSEFSGSPLPQKPAALRRVPSIPIGRGDVSSARFLYSPDSLSGLQDLIRSARERIEVEFMDLPSNWKEEGSNFQNPIVSELIRAAERSIPVRVLLNQDFNPKAPRNLTTAQLLEQLGRCTRIPITARIADSRAAGIVIIHNKGFLIDRMKTLVSSINGTRNSVMNNREVALMLESRDAARYYGNAFDFDWHSSRKLGIPPCALRVFGEVLELTTHFQIVDNTSQT